MGNFRLVDYYIYRNYMCEHLSFVVESDKYQCSFKIIIDKNIKFDLIYWFVPEHKSKIFASQHWVIKSFFDELSISLPMSIINDEIFIDLRCIYYFKSWIFKYRDLFVPQNKNIFKLLKSTTIII